jgi:glycosyltransferase involved in cell wall biosynthesis
MKSLVSIIVPVFNSEKYLKQAIDSALEQSWQNKEIIVVDDGSTDNSFAIARSFQSHQIKVIQQTNQGGCAARNRGFAESKGEYIQWLDADDYLEPTKIEDQIKAALLHPDAVIYGVWINRIETKSKVQFSSRNLIEPTSDPLGVHLAGMLAPTVAFLTPRSAINKIGGWDESLAADQDGDLLMRLMLQDIPFIHAPGGGGIWRHHSSLHRVSKSCSLKSISSRYQVCCKVIEQLQQQNKLNQYAQLLAWKLDRLAQLAILDYPTLAEKCLIKAQEIFPHYQPQGSHSYQLLRKFFGLQGSEKIRHLHTKIKQQIMPNITEVSPWLTKKRLTTVEL